jgi:tetratricopeptide (TPR) repeat protein
MTLTDYTSLINKPQAINDLQTTALEKIVDAFPYFQSARALRLKGLYNQNSFKYNQTLKVTAAHTTDRSVLFDFITSDAFITLKNEKFDYDLQALQDIEVIETNEVTETVLEDKTPEIVVDTLEQSILISIKEAEQQENKLELPQEMASPATKWAHEKLEIGAPLTFKKDEKHSFQEWLQLSNFAVLSPNLENLENKKIEEEERQKKAALIDKFIETNPKIVASKDAVLKSLNFEPIKENDSFLMTETLARVYLEQKKYQKAIQAYEILILKYPEKSSLFADRILDIKFLQQNNN